MVPMLGYDPEKDWKGPQPKNKLPTVRQSPSSIPSPKPSCSSTQNVVDPASNSALPKIPGLHNQKSTNSSLMPMFKTPNKTKSTTASSTMGTTSSPNVTKVSKIVPAKPQQKPSSSNLTTSSSKPEALAPAFATRMTPDLVKVAFDNLDINVVDPKVIQKLCMLCDMHKMDEDLIAMEFFVFSDNRNLGAPDLKNLELFDQVLQTLKTGSHHSTTRIVKKVIELEAKDNAHAKNIAELFNQYALLECKKTPAATATTSVTTIKPLALSDTESESETFSVPNPLATLTPVTAPSPEASSSSAAPTPLASIVPTSKTSSVPNHLTTLTPVTTPMPEASSASTSMATHEASSVIPPALPFEVVHSAPQETSSTTAKELTCGLGSHSASPENQEPVAIEDNNNRQKQITVVNNDLVCPNCHEAFKAKNLLTRHVKTTKCKNKACKIEDENHTAFHNDRTLIYYVYDSKDDAVAASKQECPSSMYYHNPGRNEIKCRYTSSHGCTSMFAIRNGNRFVGKNEFKTGLWILVGCKVHSGHSIETPMLGYCSGSHQHIIVDNTCETKESALDFAKMKLQNYFRTETTKLSSTIKVVCQFKGCDARINIYPRKKPIEVKGCLKHCHDPITALHEEKCIEDHIHEPIKEVFPTLEAAQKYVYDEMLDSQFIIRTTYRPEEKFSQYYVCSRSGDYEAIHQTKKLGFDCPGHFAISSKVSEDGVTQFHINGCKTHNHPIEEKFLRKSKKTDDEISALLGVGIPKQVLKDRYFSISKDDGSRKDKPIVSKDIDRIKLRDHPEPSTSNMAYSDALMSIMRQEDIHLFNLNSLVPNQEDLLDDVTRGKLIDTDEDRLLILRMSNFQREVFRSNPYLVFADGKYYV